MDISLILRVSGLGLLVAIATQILSKSGRDDQATFVAISGILVVFFLLVQQIGDLFSAIRTTFGF